MAGMMMGVRPALGAVLLLGVTACDPAAAPARQEVAAASRVERPAPTSAPQTAPVLPAQIDPAPADVAQPEIVQKEDIRVNGEPACAVTVRYKGAVDQPVTWNREPCAAITADFVSLGELRRLDKIERLSPETLADLERAPVQPVFHIESEFTASIYPLNSAGRVYEVSVAD